MNVKCAVIGLGMGAGHARALSRIPNATLVAVSDLDPARSQKIAHEQNARPYGDWREMLEAEKDLDAVILATPAILRREPIEAICERKIALFCEKPPALNHAEALRISETIARAGIINSVGFMYRWSPLAERMRELISGRPRLFARTVVAWPVFDWVAAGGASKLLNQKKTSGGPLIEQAIHFQDVLRYITGDEPISVQAISELGQLIPKEGRDCEETTAYLLRHQSGMLSTHVHNWSHKGMLLQLQVVGAQFDLTWQMEGARRLHGTVEGEVIDQSSDADLHFEEVAGFIEAVRRGDQGLVRSSYADASRSLAVCETATLALAGGGALAIA
jgi:predicted dehydrogenase